MSRYLLGALTVGEGGPIEQGLTRVTPNQTNPNRLKEETKALEAKLVSLGVESKKAIKEELQRRALRMMTMRARGEDALRKATVWSKLRMNWEKAKSARGKAKLEAEITEQRSELQKGVAMHGSLEQELAKAKEREAEMEKEKAHTLDLLQQERDLVAALKDGHTALAKQLEEAQREAESFRQDAVDREAELERVQTESVALKQEAQLKKQEVKEAQANAKAARIKELHGRAVELLAGRIKGRASVRRALAFAKLRQFGASQSATIEHDKISLEREFISPPSHPRPQSCDAGS